jgi:hypothetical protein
VWVVEVASMSDHGPRSPRWQGHPRKYQTEAHAVFHHATGSTVLPWSLIRTTCDLPMCLDAACMIVLAPVEIKYPKGICTYCGEPAFGRDHLLPKPMTGEALRKHVLTVTSCKDCNARINDFPSYCVTERRERAHQSIRRNNRELLERPDRTSEDLAELGPTLRSVAIKNQRKRDWLRTRLAWPDDPFYDLRAFQRSGIDDPVALDLIAPIEYRRTA